MSDCVIDQEPLGECGCAECEEHEEASFAIGSHEQPYDALVSILENTDIPRLNAIKQVEILMDLGVIHEQERVSEFKSQAIKFMNSL